MGTPSIAKTDLNRFSQKMEEKGNIEGIVRRFVCLLLEDKFDCFGLPYDFALNLQIGVVASRICIHLRFQSRFAFDLTLKSAE